MSRPLILAIDQGTTNSKAVLIAADCSVVASASERVPISFPRPGWVESDAVEVLHTVERAVAACLAQTPGEQALAIGISNQRESVVVWEAVTGVPLGPLVSWQCGRGVDHCAAVRAMGVEARVREISGLPLDPMFSASKLAWLLDSVPNGRARAAAGELRAGTVDSWLLWHLTGGDVHATDLTNASRTQLLDLDAGEWSPVLLDAFGIPAAVLPRVQPSSSHFGNVRGRGALDGVPIRAMAGDSHAALVGHGALRPGRVKATFGTGTSVMAPVAQRVRTDSLASTIGWSWKDTDGVAHVVPAIEGNIYATGAALEWVAELLGLGHDVGALDELARTCATSGGVTFVPAFTGLGAPHWVPAARGCIGGLTRGSGRAEIARAAFEAVAHQVADVLDALVAAGGGTVDALAVDGGAMRGEFLARTVADITAATVVRTDIAEVAALGAAQLAGLASGVWRDPVDLEGLARPSTAFAPSLAAVERAGGRAAWRAAVDRVIGPGGD